MPDLTRRHFIATGAAFTATAATAQGGAWAGVTAQAAALDQCHAIVVHQGGAEVLSQVFRGPALGRAVPMKSVSKTIVAALMGAALDRGEIPSLQSTLADVAPHLIPRGADARVGTITIENLVTMQAGLERTSGANYGSWVSSSNWVANALSRPFVAEPGGGMLYSTGSFHVLGAILAEVSGDSLLRLARDRLGRPLGIDIPAWTRDPQGRYLGGNEMALTLPAMVRFGEMYRRGRDVGWHASAKPRVGCRIVSAPHAVAVFGAGLWIWLVSGAGRWGAICTGARLWRAGDLCCARSGPDCRHHVRSDTPGAQWRVFRRLDDIDRDGDFARRPAGPILSGAHLRVFVAA